MKNLIKMSEDCGVFDEASFLYEVLAELLLHPTESPDEGCLQLVLCIQTIALMTINHFI